MNAQNHNQRSCEKISSTIFHSRYSVTKVCFTILYSLYLALSLIRFVQPARLLLTSTVTGLGLLALILLSIRIRKDYVPIYIFAGLLLTSFLISSLFVSRSERIGHVVLFILVNGGIALILLSGYVHSWGGYIVFYGLTGYFLSFMFAGVIPGLIPGQNFACSFNAISMMMLVACIPLYITLSMENKQIDLKPALITVVISIWAIGRSGIISSCVLLLGLLFARLRAKPKAIFVVLISVIVSVSIAYVFRDVVYMFAMDHSILSNATSRFLASATGEVPNSRSGIWANYFNNLDISRVMFGVNVLTDPWPDGELLAYNYHNSFINLHLQTGFMGLITLSLIIASFFKFYKTNTVFFILLLTVSMRWFTDIGMFFESWDFVMYFFIFYYLRSVHFRVPHSLFPLFTGITSTGLGEMNCDISGRSIMNPSRKGI